MKVAELRQKSVAELNSSLSAELEKQFKLRMQKTTGQLSQTHLLSQVRDNIARIKTVLNEKSGG